MSSPRPNTQPAVLVATRADAARRQRTRLMIHAIAAAGYEVDLVGPDVRAGTLPIRVHHPLERHYGRTRVGRRIKSEAMLGLDAATAVSSSDRLLEYHLGRTYGLGRALSRAVRSGGPYRGILVEEVELLPWAVQLGRRLHAPVIMDVHDIHWVPNGDSFRDRTKAGRTRRVLRDFLPRTAMVISVSDAQRALLQDLVGVDSTVIMSCSPFVELTPSPVYPGEISLVHHGQALRDRRLGELVDVVAGLGDGYTLDLYLTRGDAAYIGEMERRAAATTNVRVREPVPLDSLVPATNRYDVGIAYFEPTTPNLATTVPTKFFEYIQARLAVLTGPSPDMARLVREHRTGVVTDGFCDESLRRALLGMAPAQVREMKQRSHAVAAELSFEAERAKLAGLLSEMLR